MDRKNVWATGTAVALLGILMLRGIDASETTPTAVPERITQALAESFEVESYDSPLADLLEVVSEQSQIPIHLDRSALEMEGIDADTMVSCELRGISLEATLAHLLRPLGLTCFIDEDLLLVTTVDDAEQRSRRTEPFRVDDLDASSSTDGDERGFRGARLSDVLQKTIAADSWESMGGDGTITHFRGNMIVQQTSEVLQQVGDLLETLRRITPSTQQPNPTATSYPVARPQHQERWRQWQSTVQRPARLHLAETPLSDAIQEFSERLEMPFVLDDVALEAEGIDALTPISGSFRDVTWRTAFEHLLRPLGITLVCVDEVILVTTHEAALAHTELHAYPVGDLVPSDSAHGADALVTAIVGAVAPESWETQGGDGAIAYFPPKSALVIAQTAGVHERVRRLLEKLRRTECTHSVSREDPIFRAHYALDRSRIDLEEDEIHRLIIDFVDVQDWQQADVKIAVIPGRVIVQHRRATHRKVEAFLKELDLLDTSMSTHPPRVGEPAGTSSQSTNRVEPAASDDPFGASPPDSQENPFEDLSSRDLFSDPRDNEPFEDATVDVFP